MKRMFHRAAVACVSFGLSLAFGEAVHAEGKPADLDARLQKAFQMLDGYAAHVVETRGIPGLSLAVTDRDGLLHTATFGYADIKLKTPVTAQTRFEIGSISKSFTAIALLQLSERGKFDPQQPITTYLPWQDNVQATTARVQDFQTLTGFEYPLQWIWVNDGK